MENIYTKSPNILFTVVCYKYGPKSSKVKRTYVHT